jgi:hypothetical protein
MINKNIPQRGIFSAQMMEEKDDEKQVFKCLHVKRMDQNEPRTTFPCLSLLELVNRMKVRKNLDDI